MAWFERRRAAALPRVEPTIAVPRAAGPAAGASDFQRPEQWTISSFGGRASAAGVRVNEDAALTLPAALQAYRILTGVFAMAPLHYYARTDQGRERASASPVYRLFHDRPNPVQSPFAFMELLLGDVLLAGNFFAYVSRDRRQTPVALTRLDPLQVAVSHHFDRASGMELFYDATLPDGSLERFASRDVWHVPGFTRDGLYGLNPVRYMSEALGSAIATGEYAGRFWANDAKPAMVLTTSQKVDKDTKERIKADWNSRFAGAGNAHATAVLDQDLKPQVIQADNEKAQFLETRVFQVVDIARCWGVPPHLLFELSKATFGNIEHQSLEFVTYHLGPHFARVASAATRAFAEDGHYFEHLTDALLRGDIKARWEAYKAARETGVLSADEIRERENLNHIGGRAGEERWRPANMAVSGTDPAPPGAPRPAD